MSFFPIKDSSGTTQLVVNRKRDLTAHLGRLSDIPVESTVLIEGLVHARPETARRTVSPLHAVP